MSKDLIAFYSRADENYVNGVIRVLDVGNTEVAAGIIKELTDADLFKIEQLQAYSKDYNECIAQAQADQKRDARPELKAYPENIDDYDTIYLGYPNWWADLPMPVYSFLEEYDFGAKTIIPFITHGGSGASRTLDTISQLQPGALMMGNERILSRNAVSESEDTVVAWAQGLGMLRIPQICAYVWGMFMGCCDMKRSIGITRHED